MCRKRSAIVILDDAHGTGVMGNGGRGTADHFHVEEMVDISVGTFSKTFAVTGGFAAASRGIVDYLRFFARSYMFSASLPPAVIAGVHAGLDLMEEEPELITRLRANAAYAGSELRKLGFTVTSPSAILPLVVPPGMNIRQAAREFHRLGIFLNSVEYPAVPLAEQRFRISLMATHTRNDIDRLVEAVDAVWKMCPSKELRGETVETRAA
jgi:glycine C-acetyltransferase